VSRSKFFMNTFYNDVSSVNNSASSMCVKERNRHSTLRCKWNDNVKVYPKNFVHKICKLVCHFKCRVELRGVFNTVLKLLVSIKGGNAMYLREYQLVHEQSVVYEARMMAGVSDVTLTSAMTGISCLINRTPQRLRYGKSSYGFSVLVCCT